MNVTIIAAVIGGVFTVIGPIATFLITRYVDNKDKQVMSFRRRAAMSGKWSGTTTQDSGNYSSHPLPIVFRAVATRKTIKGEFCVQYPKRENSPARDDEFTFQGGFFHDRFMQLDYISKNEGRIQFGSAILELSPSAEFMTGRYAGYGAFSKEIVTGNLELRRAA
jgi:hypothetical protein